MWVLGHRPEFRSQLLCLRAVGPWESVLTTLIVRSRSALQSSRKDPRPFLYIAQQPAELWLRTGTKKRAGSPSNLDGEGEQERRILVRLYLEKLLRA